MRYSYGFGINSSKILLGTAYFGSSIKKDECFKIMDRYYELGGRHIDTARLYSEGVTEEIVAEWAKSRKPENIHISTKGGYPHPNSPLTARLSENELRSDLEESLKALRTDCIDFYWLHCDNNSIPSWKIIDTLNQFVKEGKIKKFGASNWSHERVKEANEYAKNNSLYAFEAVQIRFSPAVVVGDNERQDILEDMDKLSFDFYANESIPVAAYASQAKGFFSKMYEYGESGLSDKAKERYLCGKNLDKFKYIKSIAQAYNCSIATVVCSALCSLERPNVFPIIGASKVFQLEDSISGGDMILSDDELNNIFDIIQ